MAVKTALVVDDSKSARFAMRKCLEGFGWAVEASEGAQEGLAILGRSMPQALFLDHIMPGIDGFEMLRQMRTEGYLGKLPIVLCSSNEGEAFVREARALGATEILQKPPTPDQLRELLDRLAAWNPAGTQTAASTPAPSASAGFRLHLQGGSLSVVDKKPSDDGQTSPLGGITFKKLAPDAPPSPPVAPQPGFEFPARAPDLAGSSIPAASQRDDAGVRIDNLRNEVTTRVRRVTQELFAQMGEVKSQVSRMDALLRDTSHQNDVATGAASAALRDQIDTIANHVEGITIQLRKELDDALQAQNQRLDDFAADLRKSIVADAQAAFEATIQAAIMRTSDQIKASVLEALKPSG